MGKRIEITDPAAFRARVQELLTYDPITGIFTQRISRGGERAGNVAGTVSNTHRQIHIDGRLYKAHRLAWLIVYGEWPASQIDHKDNCGDHNWISNLRLATDTQNRANSKRRADNTSGFKGVTFDKARGKWLARVQIDRRPKHLGYFEDPAIAHEAYVNAAREIFGEFVRPS